MTGSQRGRLKGGGAEKKPRTAGAKDQVAVHDTTCGRVWVKKEERCPVHICALEEGSSKLSEVSDCFLRFLGHLVSAAIELSY